MSTLAVEALVEGQMYRVVFRPPSGQGRDMEMVAKYLGQDHQGLAFNLRPKAGTTNLDTRSLVALYLSDATEVTLPRRVVVETRVF